MKRVRFLGVAVALAIVFSAGASVPEPAASATYDYTPCSGALEGHFLPEWRVTNPFSLFWLEAPCGGDWNLRMQLGSWFNTSAKAILKLPGDEVKSLRLTVAGKDRTDEGLPQYLLVCNGDTYPQDCGTPVRGSTLMFNMRQPLELNEANGYVPPGADRLMLFSACTGLDPSLNDQSQIDPATAELCTPSADDPRFNISSVQAVDSDSPKIDGLDFTPGQWVKSVVGIKFAVSDDTSGVEKIAVQSNWESAPNSQPVCGLRWNGYTCPLSAEVELQGLVVFSGLNSYDVTAYDMAGNSVAKHFSVRFDPHPPPSPSSLSVGASNGWLIGNHATLSWVNYPEDLPTQSSSGVVSATVDLVDSLGREAIGYPRVERGVGIASVPLDLPGTDRWTATVRLTDAAGNVGSSASITFDNTNPISGQPQIKRLDPINLDAAAGGVTIGWNGGGYSRAGVCAFRGWIGNGSPPNLKLDPSTTLPGSLDQTWKITPAGLLKLDDGTATVAIAAVDCAGQVTSSGTATVLVDRHPPSARLASDRSWQAGERPLELSASDAAGPVFNSGVKSVWFRVDGGAKQVIQADHAELPRLAPGAHTVYFGATDNAGNTAQEIEISVGIDTEAPVGRIEQIGSSAVSFRATSVDALSGVTDATLSLCAAGQACTRIGDRFHADEGVTAPVSIETRIPAGIAPGAYWLELATVDAAGNTATTIRDLRLPLTQAPRLVAVIATAEHPSATKREITLRFGQRAVLSGRLTAAGGAPLASRRLNVIAQRGAAGGRRRLATLTTRADGSYRLRLGRDVSRTIEVRFAGDDTFSGATASVNSYVRASLSIHLPHRRIKWGSKLLVTGRIRLLSASLPARGIPVSLHFCGRHRCFSIGTSRNSDSAGGYWFAPSTRPLRRGSYRLYASVDALSSGWPFAEGRSRVREVVIR